MNRLYPYSYGFITLTLEKMNGTFCNQYSIRKLCDYMCNIYHFLIPTVLYHYVLVPFYVKLMPVVPFTSMA